MDALGFFPNTLKKYNFFPKHIVLFVLSTNPKDLEYYTKIILLL